MNTYKNYLTQRVTWPDCQAFVRLLLEMLVVAFAEIVLASFAFADDKLISTNSPLGAGDTVLLRVYGQSDMDGTVYVGDDGTLSVPLAGPILVAGLSPNDAAHRIEKALSDGNFLNNPHVTIVVSQSKSQRVTVLGEVHSPGRFPIESRSTILDVLALAGGLTENAGDTVFVLHPEQDETVTRRVINLHEITQKPDQAVDRTISAGESIYVPRADVFYVYGAVTSPNSYRLDPGMTVRQAIARAGGVSARGSSSRIDIERRRENGDEEVIHSKPNDLIKANDVIKVKESLF